MSSSWSYTKKTFSSWAYNYTKLNSYEASGVDQQENWGLEFYSTTFTESSFLLKRLYV